MNGASIARAELSLPVAQAEPPRRLADVLVDILVDAGVDAVFGLPGGPIAPIHDALIDRGQIRTIITCHECDAVFAAAGYAQATGKLAVVAVTSGPGILNALTGLASAFCDGLPVLILAGEVARSRFGRGALQEGSSRALDIIGMARTITKFAAEAGEPNSVPALLRRAVATATSGRPGPVLVTLPMDVTTSAVSPPLIALQPRLEFDLDPRVVDAAAGALSASRRGVLFVGSGARWGNGPELVRQLAERLQLPVMTTPKAKGVFPESHPLSLGVFGWGGHPSSSEYLRGGVDVLMAVGSGLGEAATDNWSSLLAPSKHFIQIDAEARQLGRNFPVTIGLVGTAEGVLRELLDRLPAGRPRARSFGVERQEPGRNTLVGAEGKLAPQRALWELQQVLPASTLYSADMGEHTLFAIHHLHIDDPRGFALMMGLSSMGSGIGAAVGMKVARPDATVVSICGDGGLAMCLGDVATVAREGIPILIAVMNDQRYGMVEIGDMAVYGRTRRYPSGPMNIPDLARAVGAQGVLVEKPGDILRMDIPKLLSGGPVVLDIRIDRSMQMSRSRIEFLKKTARGTPAKSAAN